MEKANTKSTIREMRIARMLNAPIDLVWEVGTNPEQIAHWWIPNGFTNSIYTKDVTAGGKWGLTMDGLDVKRYPNESMFIEIVPLIKNCVSALEPKLYFHHCFEPKEKEALLDCTSVLETTKLFETVFKIFKA